MQLGRGLSGIYAVEVDFLTSSVLFFIYIKLVSGQVLIASQTGAEKLI